MSISRATGITGCTASTVITSTTTAIKRRNQGARSIFLFRSCLNRRRFATFPTRVLMDRPTRAPHRQNLLAGAGAVVVGAAILVLELSRLRYVLGATLIVFSVVCPLGRVKSRKSSRG